MQKEATFVIKRFQMKKLFPLAMLFCLSGLSQAQINVSIDHTKEFQTMEGFGGFGPAKPWWESAPFYDATYLDRTIDDLGVTFFRTQIYWDGEAVNDNDNPATVNATGFNFGPSSDNGKQFPFIKDLSDRGAKIIATVWTPPTWMKLFDDADRRPTECYNCYQCTVGNPGTEMCGGRLNPELYDEFAEYLTVYVKTLKEKTGVDLYGISIQNEPFFANPFESNVVLPEEYADILRTVGERFDQEGLNTKFFGPEHMAEWSWGWQTKYVNEILGDPSVNPHLDIYAVHGYVDGVAADYGSAEGWTALYDNIALAHDKPLWMTETSDFSVTGFPLAFSMSKSLYLAIRFGRISAWVYWSMHDAVVKNNQLTPLGYAFKNFYRYIRPGAKVIEASSSDPQILVLAFRHPETQDLSIILINTSDQSKDISMDIPLEHSELTVYRTSANENCKNLGVLTGDNVVLPPQSISTITTIEGGGVTSVEKKSRDRFTVHPNPASAKLKINLPDDNKKYSVEITDAFGRMITELKVSQERRLEIETAHWQSGAYFVRISGDTLPEVYKILIH